MKTINNTNHKQGENNMTAIEYKGRQIRKSGKNFVRIYERVNNKWQANERAHTVVAAKIQIDYKGTGKVYTKEDYNIVHPNVR